MTEPLNDKIAEIREWLVRIDTKVDMFHDVKRVAEDADEKADKALAMAQENREQIREMKSNTKWVWGTILTVFGLLITVGVAVFS